MGRKFHKFGKQENSSIVSSLGPIQGVGSKPSHRSQRQLRVGESIRHALGTLFVRGELFDPLLVSRVVTITEVQVSVDLKHAFVFVMIGKNYDEEEVLKALKKAAPQMQYYLGQNLELNGIPRLKFQVDHALEKTLRIEELFQDPHVRQDLESR